MDEQPNSGLFRGVVAMLPLFSFSHSVSVLTNEISKSRWMMPYYMVPAFLYCLYNNLSFTNLAIFDPTSYFMFLQLRLLMTGVIYQVLVQSTPGLWFQRTPQYSAVTMLVIMDVILMNECTKTVLRALM